MNGGGGMAPRARRHAKAGQRKKAYEGERKLVRERNEDEEEEEEGIYRWPKCYLMYKINMNVCH